jgi:hypothetical protein
MKGKLMCLLNFNQIMLVEESFNTCLEYNHINAFDINDQGPTINVID